MKKFLTILLTLALALVLVGCFEKTTAKPAGTTKAPAGTTQAPVGTTAKPEGALPDEFKGMLSGKTVYITTCGQADMDYVPSVLKKIGVSADTYSSNGMLNASEVAAGSVVLLMTGTSNKGLGSAGTNVTQEQERARAFVSKAKAGDITLVLLHFGGSARRGDLSDPIIRIVAEGASLMLVVSGGNSDGLFSDLAQEYSITLGTAASAGKMTEPFKVLYNIG